MVDAEHARFPPGVAPIPLTCGSKKRAATCDMTMNAVKPWKFGMLARIAKPGIFELAHSMGKVIGVSPSTLKSIGLVRVLPDVFAIDDQVLSKGLLRARRETHCASPDSAGVVPTQGAIVAAESALTTGSLHPRLERIRFSLNGRFQRAGVRNAQHGVGGLDVVSDAQARLRLFGAGDAIVVIEAESQVESPVPDGHRVLDIQRQFPNVAWPLKVYRPLVELRATVGSRQRPVLVKS